MDIIQIKRSQREPRTLTVFQVSRIPVPLCLCPTLKVQSPKSNSRVGMGARPPRAQFSLPSRKTSCALNRSATGAWGHPCKLPTARARPATPGAILCRLADVAAPEDGRTPMAGHDGMADGMAGRRAHPAFVVHPTGSAVRHGAEISPNILRALHPRTGAEGLANGRFWLLTNLCRQAAVAAPEDGRTPMAGHGSWKGRRGRECSRWRARGGGRGRPPRRPRRARSPQFLRNLHPR